MRGGPAFEFLLNVHHRLKKLGLRDKFDLIFFAPMPKPGIRMGEKAVSAMDTMFRKLGIRSYTGKKITEFDEGAVTLEDGTRIEADLVMFIAAGDGHGVVKASDLPLNEAGFVLTEPTCEVQGHPWLYAVGDVAALEGPGLEGQAGPHRRGHGPHGRRRHRAQDRRARRAGQLRGRGLHPLRHGHGERRRLRLPGRQAGALHPHADRRALAQDAAGDAYYRLRKLGKVPRLPGL